MFEILLAEDNPGDVLLFREALNSSDVRCNIVVAKDGLGAITLLNLAPPGGDPTNVSGIGNAANEWHPHLIVLDVNLPKHNGDSILRQIRQQPRLKSVPVIMLTSSASPADRERAIALGADLYLQKSSDLDELFVVGKIVRAILTRSNPASASN